MWFIGSYLPRGYKQLIENIVWYEFRHANVTWAYLVKGYSNADGCNVELFVELTVVTTRNIRNWPSVMTFYIILFIASKKVPRKR